MGYAYWYDNPDQEHMFFVKGLPPHGPRSHHIHMVEPQSIFWERLLFRDYLRKHPEEAAWYLALKREMAVYFMEDREAYTDAKGEYSHIPHPHTWHLEHEEVLNAGEGRVLTLSTFADLRTYF